MPIEVMIPARRGNDIGGRSVARHWRSGKGLGASRQAQRPSGRQTATLYLLGMLLRRCQ